MRIDRKYQIERAAAKDDGRPALTYVLVEPEGAVAGDRYMLAIVPCKLDEDDEPGLVPASAFRDVRRETSRTLPELTIRLNDLGSAGRDIGRFPNWRELLPKWPRVGTRVTLSLKLLQRAAAALGTDALILTIRHPNEAVLIEPPDNEHARRISSELVAPYALVMPMYTNFGPQDLAEVAAEWASAHEHVAQREPLAEIDVAWPEAEPVEE